MIDIYRGGRITSATCEELWGKSTVTAYTLPVQLLWTFGDISEAVSQVALSLLNG